MNKPNPTVDAYGDEAPPAAIFWGLKAREAGMLAAIVLGTFVAYLPSLRNGWVFDDIPQIVKSDPLHSWAGIGKSFIYDSWWFLDPHFLPQSAYYRPLQATWFGLGFMMFGNHPWAFHLEKILLQLICVMLAFRAAQLLSKRTTIGLLTAGLFALLPANTESVVWVSAIGEPLSTTFELAALCCFIRRKPGWSCGLTFALILYACALLSHETAILFGAVIAAYVFLFEDAAGGSIPRRIVVAARACVPFVLLAIVYLFARLNALGAQSFFGLHQAVDSGVARGFVEPRPHHSVAQMLMTLPKVLFAYLAELVLPQLANPTHAIQWTTHLQVLTFVWWTALLMLAVAIVALSWRSANRGVFVFCAVWSVMTIAPALNLNALWYLVDDRYLYAPSFGFSLAAAVVATQLASAGWQARKVVGATIAVFIAACVVSTMRMERYWYDDVAFFQRCVEITPYDTGYRVRLAAAMNKAGDLEGAVRVLKTGIVLNPDNVQIHMKLAAQYQMMGRVMDFQREFLKFNLLSAEKIRRRDSVNPDAAQPSQP